MTIEVPGTLGAIVILLLVTVGCFYVGGFITALITSLVWPEGELGIMFVAFWGAIISAGVGFYFALDYVLGAVT
jgi:hypothetical protein